MRKDLKKRLEKALITLQEPGGSTIRSIMNVINHDSPVLSLRKVLEALQEGINEGFLCMYNGRFKLRQQLYGGKENTIFGTNELRRNKELSPDSDLPEEESEFEDDDIDEEEEDLPEEDDEEDSSMNFKGKHGMVLKRNVSPEVQELPKKMPSKKRTHTPSRAGPSRGKRRRYHSKDKSKRKKKGKTPRKRQQRAGTINIENLISVSSESLTEKKPGKMPTEKPDLKKQRGPRCTSMKKEVRMPSKVHIPFVSPSVPQKGSNLNDLVRRSPDPVNGPLFDNHLVKDLGLFESHC